MPWFLMGLYWCLWLCVLTTGLTARTLPSIHWNASNSMFKTSNNDHIVEVNLYDDIDFVCPQNPPGQTDPSMSEFYAIHQVSKREYDECYLNSSVKPTTIVNCNKPHSPLRFTIIFEPFVSIPDVPEYHSGGTYYFITTSTGSIGGMLNDHQGACLFQNMKLTIKVCCDSTTTTKHKATTSGRRPRVTSSFISTLRTQTPHPKSTPGLTRHTSAPASTERSTLPTVQPTPARTSHLPTKGKPEKIYPTDKPPGSKDKEVPDGKDKNEVDPESPKHTGPASRTSLHHRSASWTLCLLATFIFLLTRS